MYSTLTKQLQCIKPSATLSPRENFKCCQETTSAPATVGEGMGRPMEAMLGEGTPMGSAGLTMTEDKPTAKGLRPAQPPLP